MITAIFGLITWYYARRSLNEQIRQGKRDLIQANKDLENSKEILRETKDELKLIKGGIPDDIEILANVQDALEKLNKIIKEQADKNNKVQIQIFGLDLQSIIPWLITTFVQDDAYNNVYLTFRLMLVNPNIKIIKPMIDDDSNISRDAITNSIKRVKSIADLNDIDRIQLELRQYKFLPIIHGYLVDNEYLGIAFTQVEKGKLYGGRYPYICCRKDGISKFKNHLFGIYETWFEFYWRTGAEIIKFKK